MLTTQTQPAEAERGMVLKSSWFTVNRACNMRCGWCYGQGTGYGAKDNMTLELAQALIAIMAELQVRQVTVIGGEPTLWPHLPEFNRMCRQAGCRTTLVTNALRFGDDEFWERYLASPSNAAGISIKGHDACSILQLTGTRDFAALVTGLRRATGFHKCGVSVVHSLASRGKLPDLARFALDCGAKSLSVSLCTPAITEEGINRSWVPDPMDTISDILACYPELERIMKGKLTFSLKLPLCLWPKEFVEMLIARKQITTVCQLQKRNGIVFDVDGKLALCNSLWSNPVGEYGRDYTDAAGLMRLLHSSPVTQLYNKVTSYPAKRCLACERYAQCAGGCPMYWLAFNPAALIDRDNT